jgi:hypothetical protein
MGTFSSCRLLEKSAGKPSEAPGVNDLARRVTALEDAEKKRKELEAKDGSDPQSRRRSSSTKAGGASEGGPSTGPEKGGESEALQKELERVAKLAEESGARLKVAEVELRKIGAQVEQQGAAQNGQAERIKVN